MKVVAQVQELLFCGDARQSQFPRSFTKPLTRNRLPFHVVITNAQVFAKIRFRISQTVLGLHRQHGGTLNHVGCNYALWVTQNEWPEMIPVNRIGNGTLFSLRVQGAAVTTKALNKNQMADESKIMNATIVTAEAKARLAEAVNHYTPPAPEKYRALNEVKDSIFVLRERKASYETIRVML